MSGAQYGTCARLVQHRVRCETGEPTCRADRLDVSGSAWPLYFHGLTVSSSVTFPGVSAPLSSRPVSTCAFVGLSSHTITTASIVGGTARDEKKGMLREEASPQRDQLSLLGVHSCSRCDQPSNTTTSCVAVLTAMAPQETSWGERDE